MKNNATKTLFFLLLICNAKVMINAEPKISKISGFQNSRLTPPENKTEKAKPVKPPKGSTEKKPEKTFISKSNAKSTNQKPTKTLIPFSFKNEKLATLVENLANAKNINILYPQRAAEAEAFNKQVVTYQPQGNKNISLDQAWALLTFFLDLSGYAWFEKNETLWEITLAGKPDEAGINKEPLPLYVGTKPENLPNSEESIRYLYYLTNLNVDDKALQSILTDMKSETASTPIYLPRSNGFILIDKANNIASTITLISKLDETGFRERIEVIPLYNVSAQSTADIFKSLKAASGEANNPYIRVESGVSSAYFTGDTQIVPDLRQNRLIVMGRDSAVERIKSFIHNHIDLEADTGKSILHHYSLQYLDAQTFAPVLQKIVKTTGDSQGTQGKSSGPERALQGVIVEAEKIVEVQQVQGTMAAAPIQTNTGTSSGFDAKGVLGKVQMGGNRLIIAAMEDDWQRVKELIDKLDKPQPQVILEVMIADFTANPQKQIQGAIRNGTNMSTPSKGIDFLADHLTPSVNNLIGATPTSLATDLLQVVNGGATNSVASLFEAGPLLISFNDPSTPNNVNPNVNGLTGGIWGLIKVLDFFTDTKIISHPYLISTNNLKATKTQQVTKRARRDEQPTQSGVITIQIENVSASIQVQMIPRISSEERLGLQVAVDINDFNGTSLNRSTRRVETNAHMNSGQIFVIGGLTKITNNDSLTSTPLFYKIPFFGQFFQGAKTDHAVSNVVIFISPTIVQPKLRGGLNLYTKDKIDKSKRDIDDNLIFGQSKDPITRLFFNQKINTNNRMIKEYLYETDNAPTEEEKNEIDEVMTKKPAYKKRQRSYENRGNKAVKKLNEIPA